MWLANSTINAAPAVFLDPHDPASPLRNAPDVVERALDAAQHRDRHEHERDDTCHAQRAALNIADKAIDAMDDFIAIGRGFRFGIGFRLGFGGGGIETLRASIAVLGRAVFSLWSLGVSSS